MTSMPSGPAPGTPSMINPIPSCIPDREARPSHFATILSVPSMIVASIASRPFRGSILMFWITPATRVRWRGSTFLMVVTSPIDVTHRRRFSARMSSGERPSFSMTLLTDTTRKYGSIAALLG